MLRVALLVALLSAPAMARPAAAGTVAPTVTVDLHEADIVNVIRLFAEVGGKNVVVADDVKGKVTMRLKGVAWRTALDVVLKSGGFGLVEEANVLWVTTQARLDADEQRELDLAEQRALKGPLSTRVVPVNNGDAKAMAEVVKPLLSARGSVVVDTRTNTLIIRDVAGSIALR